MTWNLYIALFAFAGIAAWTPGPNNTILMASGINHGFRQTVPMIFGIGIGFPLMIGIIGLGLGQVFEAYPQINTAMKVLGAAYMLWIAWKIATSRPNDGSGIAGKPFTFLQGALFQWVNPKGWMMAMTALSAYTLQSDYYTGVAVVVATFVLMGFTSASAWAVFGASLRHVMNDPKWFRIINLGLAATLVASLYPMLAHH
jgi:threonine/homoserine/homoserine lactone efflux protein